LKIVFHESGTLSGDIQGNFFWTPDSILLGNGLGGEHGTGLCNCTIAGRTGSFLFVSASGANQPTHRFTITKSYGGLAGMYGTLVAGGGTTGFLDGMVQFT
jgi:hypothetical protein